MKHPELERLLSPDPEVAAHLQRCPRCRVAVRMYRRHNQQPTLAVLSEDGITAEEELPEPPERYSLHHVLGRGGMGEVYRVYDRVLRRELAMKRLRPGLHGHPVSRDRFLTEAQLTAQLQHPGIVPVHDLGTGEDGVPYFTMKEVRGRNLDTIIEEVHTAGIAAGAWVETPGGWSLRRLIETFHRACEAVAYAHSRGCIHRDLKPSNIMVGSYGEVMVVDWGLARLLNSPARPERPLDTDRDPLYRTRDGVVAGTPSYMSPEQVRGAQDELDVRSDVYALGAVLYQILSGRPPYIASRAEDILAQVLDGTLKPPTAEAPLPQVLVAICCRAMAVSPAARFQDVAALIEEVTAWQDGIRRRERASQLLQETQQLRERVRQQRAQALTALQRAQEALLQLDAGAPLEARLPLWKQQDEAEALLVEVEANDAEYGAVLRAALIQDPDYSAAREALSGWYREHHQRAERARDAAAAARWARLLRRHDPAGSHHWLRWQGTLNLQTEPSGADVELWTYRQHERRLVPERVGIIGQTPLRDWRLPVGSHLLILHADGRVPVRYPVFIERGEHWRSQNPEERPCTVYLPPVGAVADNECYVPAGWFRCGEEGRSLRWAWLDGFCIRRDPITNAEWLLWLNTLLEEGRSEEAHRCVPRDRGTQPLMDGAPLFGMRDGRFILKDDPDGDTWNPHTPVVMLRFDSMLAYALDMQRRTGLPWRLPFELEWEKAARGVDGRICPWGNTPDPAWANTLHSTPGRPLPVPVQAFSTDVSPYGVRGMAGNVSDWCLDLFRQEPPLIDVLSRGVLTVPPEDATEYRSNRGGCWIWSHRYSRSELRFSHPPTGRTAEIGCRLLRPLGPL